MAKKTEAEIEIAQIVMSRITCHLIGYDIIMHRYSKKAREQLLFPKGRINSAEKAENLKHDPLGEYRECFYRNRDDKEPSLFHLPTGMFSKALAAAALDIPGPSKAQILRLSSVTTRQINLFGVPRMFMAMTRSSDMAHTPDVRTRPVFPECACKIEIEFVSSLLKQNAIVNLLAAAGVIVGIGDWRPQKGGPHGKFKIVDANDPDYLRIVKTGGRVAQRAAYDAPVAYDFDTEELYAWFNEEVERREKVVPSAAGGAASPRLRERLRGPVGEGFDHSKSSIEASIAAATPIDRKKSAAGDASAEVAPSSQLPPVDGDGATTSSATPR
jgi:hypothetical protein